MNELNKLYKQMVMSWGGAVKPDHRIVLKVGDAEIDIKVDDMFVYLPVSEVLDSTDTMNKVFFHPACENITSKETEIFKIIRRMASIRLLELFKKYPTVLFSVANGKEKRNWNQGILDIIEPLKQAKKATVTEVNELMKRFRVEMEESGLDNRFIHLKVSKVQGRSQTGSGERVYYKTKPVFPIYNEIVKRLSQSEGQSDNQTVELNGVSVSRAALKLMAHLFRVVLPAVNDPDSFTFEATNSIAARLVSYCGCFESIAEQLNRIQNLFRADFDKLGIYPIDLSWTEDLERIGEIYNQIPAMDYNTHNTQEEVVSHNQSLAGMSGMFSVNSTPTQIQQQLNHHQVQNHNQNYQQQQQNQNAGAIIAGFVTTPPPMIAGDRWLRFEIDPVSNQVIHHALNTMTNAPVIYYCTKSGSFLQRIENQGGAVGGIPGLPTPGLGALMGSGLANMNPMAAMMAMSGMNPALLALTGNMMGGGYSQPATTATTSIVNDGNNNSGSYTW